MKRIVVLLLLLFFQMPVFAEDIVSVNAESYAGKVLTASSNYVKIKKDGIEYSFTRKVNDDFFKDYIVYKKSPISKEQISTTCRVFFVDTYNIIFETKDTRIDIPRYRVKKLILSY